MKKKQESNLEAKDIWQVRRLSNMDSQYTAAWACWHVDLNNAAVQWGWSVETRPKPSFQISLTWQVSTRVRVVEIQLLVQYWIKTVCCRSKYHFHWTAPCTPLYPLIPKVGDIVPHTLRLRRPCSFGKLSMDGLALVLFDSPLSYYDTVIWPIKSTPKWPVMCRVGR